MSKKTIWPLLILSYVSLLAYSMIENTRSAVYPEVLSFFQVQPGAGSAIFSLSTLAGILICLTSPYWLSYLGNLRAMRLGLAFLFLSALFYSIIPLTQSSFFWFLFFSFTWGMGMGIISIPMNILVGMSTHPEFRQRAFSAFHALYGAGSLLAPLLYALWVSSGRGWPVFFLLLAFLPLIPLGYSFKISGVPAFQQERKKLVSPVGLKTRMALGALFGCYVGSEVVLSTRMVFYLQEELHFTPARSQWYLSLFFLCLFLGRLLFAALPQYMKTATAMTLSLGFSLLLLLLGIHVDPLFLSFSGFTMSCFFPLGMVWLLENYREGYEYITGSVFMSMGIYLFIAHSLFGVMATQLDLQTALHISPALGLITLILLVLLK